MLFNRGCLSAPASVKEQVKILVAVYSYPATSRQGGESGRTVVLLNFPDYIDRFCEFTLRVSSGGSNREVPVERRRIAYRYGVSWIALLTTTTPTKSRRKIRFGEIGRAHV